VSETVFYIVTEDPQVKHVASQVKPSGVHEHGREDGQKISAGIGKEATGNKGPRLNKSVTASQLYKEKQDV
jgi:hypothetical protein